ncbi:MAG: homocysteine S-methyltransferase family protein [Myxococcota bacterium]|nr:homocysteine S-methyltransferase family protein [Myxococcota bacterium]
MLRILDGPMGTELAKRGCHLPEGTWSALPNLENPEQVQLIHRAYADAGADVHTVNTFRTQPRVLGDSWRSVLKAAVDLAREALGPEAVLAGSMAPLEDCYRPDLSPVEPRPEHREMAGALCNAGVDILLCETFPHVGEALVAVEEALGTGLETWVAFTGGPDGSLLSPREVGEAGRRSLELGVSAVLVNCVAPELVLAYLEELKDLPVPVGAYANGGHLSESGPWVSATEESIADYVGWALRWVEAGATIVGSCCGTGVGHVAALNQQLRGGSQ